MDAPATGHALALLRAARTYANVARVGPIARQASLIDGFLRDRVGHRRRLRRAARGDARQRDDRPRGPARRGPGAWRSSGSWSTACCPERFSAADAVRLRGVGERGSQAARAAIESAVVEHGRVAAQREQLERLRSEARAPVTTLPHLFEPELQRRELELLSDLLEEEL